MAVHEHRMRTSVTLHLHVDDADAMIARALALGATLEREPKDEFYGERSGVMNTFLNFGGNCAAALRSSYRKFLSSAEGP